MKHIVPLLGFAMLAAGCGGGSGPSAVVSEPGLVTMHQVQTSIFTPTCAVTNCHVGANAPLGLDLSAGAALGNVRGIPSTELGGFDRIEPFDPVDSYLFMKVTDDPRILGDRMPAQGSALSSQRIEMLEDWIRQGANP